MTNIRYIIPSLLLIVFFCSSISADDSPLDKAVLAGDWQTVLDIATDSTLEHNEINEFLKEISCLALDLDCAPAFYETILPKGIEGKSIESWIESLRKRHKRNQFLSYLMANSYSRSGDHKKALKEQGRAIKQDRNIAIFYLARSRTYAIMNDFERSLKDANKAIHLDPDLSMAHTLRGSIFDAQRNYQAALKSYAEAIRLKPKRAANYYNSANTFRHMNQNSDAISEYTRSITLDSTLVGAYFNRANAYYDESQYEKALIDYRKFVAVATKESKRMLPRANSQIRTIERILSGKPEDESDVLVDRGVRAFQLNNFDEAIRQLNKALAIDSTKSDAYYWRASTFIRLGKKQQAIDDYTQAIRYHPNDTTAFFNRGALFVETDRLHEAIRDFSSAIELNKAYILAYENRAEAYENIGLNDSAVMDYEALLTIIPDSDNKQREYFNDIIEFLSNPKTDIDTDEIKKVVEEAYKRWEKQEWKKFAKLISYNDIMSFQKELTSFALGLFGQNEYVVLYGDVYRKSYFIDDEPHVSFALYMKLFSNNKSALKPMVKLQFVEVVEIIPRGLKHAIAKIRIKVDPGGGKIEMVIDNDLEQTSSGWRINMPPSLENVIAMLIQGPGPR